MPLADLLLPFGVRFEMRPAESQKDRGGKKAKVDQSILAARGDMGVWVKAANGGASLEHVLDGGPAQAAGLSGGDVVVALDGLRVKGTELIDRVGELVPGSQVEVHAFRRDELRTFSVTIRSNPSNVVYLTLISDPTPEQLARRTAWLGS